MSNIVSLSTIFRILKSFSVIERVRTMNFLVISSITEFGISYKGQI